MAQGTGTTSVCGTSQPKKMLLLKSQEPVVVYAFYAFGVRMLQGVHLYGGAQSTKRKNTGRGDT